METAILQKCNVCGSSSPSLFKDKRYNQDLCVDDFEKRRLDAAKVGDAEWFQANMSLEDMTQEERARTGL